MEALDRRILAKEADVRSSEKLEAVIDEGLAMFGKIEIVVANTGIYT
ncbi:hypothetical protein [Nocardia sp. 348MFTsu5.1]|nr:hypothetical protein [Nocardia sp. 348MFTsu5.1]